MTTSKFIVYTNGTEVIVCTPRAEKSALLEYFEHGHRDLNEYDREEHQTTGVRILTAGLRIRG